MKEPDGTAILEEAVARALEAQARDHENALAAQLQESTQAHATQTQHHANLTSQLALLKTAHEKELEDKVRGHSRNLAAKHTEHQLSLQTTILQCDQKLKQQQEQHGNAVAAAIRQAVEESRKALLAKEREHSERISELESDAEARCKLEVARALAGQKQEHSTALGQAIAQLHEQQGKDGYGHGQDRGAASTSKMQLPGRESEAGSRSVTETDTDTETETEDEGEDEDEVGEGGAGNLHSHDGRSQASSSTIVQHQHQHRQQKQHQQQQQQQQWHTPARTAMVPRRNSRWTRFILSQLCARV